MIAFIVYITWDVVKFMIHLFHTNDIFDLQNKVQTLENKLWRHNDEIIKLTHDLNQLFYEDEGDFRSDCKRSPVYNSESIYTGTGTDDDKDGVHETKED